MPVPSRLWLSEYCAAGHREIAKLVGRKSTAIVTIENTPRPFRQLGFLHFPISLHLIREVSPELTVIVVDRIHSQLRPGLIRQILKDRSREGPLIAAVAPAIGGLPENLRLKLRNLLLGEFERSPPLAAVFRFARNLLADQSQDRVASLKRLEEER
ncbi:hypothetical protein [Bosea sp. BIWAKO-01]|uniref:hypothetical protein n=1 Tax=Bosea sp. BIWAKO-01 TaxID=506668 RepID=UPI00114D2644|nr:hypothetical protein [Bosea sp. BIWAKO-01]